MQTQKLEQFLKSSAQIDQILDILRNKISAQQGSNNNLNQDCLEFFDSAINLKSCFRFLADGLQTNRNLVDLQKQKIQRSKVFLEGLHYYQATLKCHIGQSQLDLIDVKEYLVQQPNENADWVTQYQSEQAKILATLSQIKSTQQLFEDKRVIKQSLSKKLQVSQDKLKKTLPQVKKLQTPVLQTSKLFNIKQFETFDSPIIRNKLLEQIYSLLYSLKLQGFVDLKLIQSDIEELQVTIQKGFFNLYEYASNNKIFVKQKPFTFSLVIIKNNDAFNQQLLVLADSQNQDFTSAQIFDNMILNQKIKPIFPYPKSQHEKQINMKYSRLEWLTTILASQSSLINGTQFINKIKEKIFSLYLTRYAVQNITNVLPSYFFPLFKESERCYQLKNLSLIQNNQISFSKFQGTTFQEYKSSIIIPEWVEKALLDCSLLRKKQEYLSSLSMDQALQVYEKSNRHQLDLFIKNNNLDDLQGNGVYAYFKFEFLIKQQSFKGYLLLPKDYPKRKSIFRLYNNQQKLQKMNRLRDNSSHFETIQNQTENAPIFSNLSQIENQINQEIKQFFQQPSEDSNNGLIKDSKKVSQSLSRKKESFLLYFQINRLISLMIQAHQNIAGN